MSDVKIRALTGYRYGQTIDLIVDGGPNGFRAWRRAWIPEGEVGSNSPVFIFLHVSGPVHPQRHDHIAITYSGLVKCQGYQPTDADMTANDWELEMMPLQ